MMDAKPGTLAMQISNRMPISQGGDIRLSRATAAVTDWLQANLRALAADLMMGTGASREICPVDLTSPGQHVLATHNVSFPVFANLEVADPLPRDSGGLIETNTNKLPDDVSGNVPSCELLPLTFRLCVVEPSRLLPDLRKGGSQSEHRQGPCSGKDDAQQFPAIPINLRRNALRRGPQP
jgi:hypothetical protein